MSRNDLRLGFLSIFACLVSGTVGRTAIIGGEKAKEHQFPYQVSVQVQDRRNKCGGGIIDHFHILTAAHCVYGDHGFIKAQFVIVAGTADYQKRTPPAVAIGVKKLYIPAEYDPKNIESTGDIAILKLKHSLEDQHHLEHLELPALYQADYAKKTARIAGFGWTQIHYNDTNEEGKNADNRLHYADADILTNEQCALHFRISANEMCARVTQLHSHHKGVCNGDSGSPLVHDKTVVGVLVATTRECIERQKPAVYTRVSHYLDFIHDAIHDQPSFFIHSYELHD